MKMKYEREQGMTSIYRKLKKECRSFTLRRHVTTLILVFALMAPAGVYADWTGCILSEKRAGQAAETGWADQYGAISLPQFLFVGNGVVHVVVYDPAGSGLVDRTVHGTARLKVDEGDEGVVLEDCDPAFSSCAAVINFNYALDSGTKIDVELKGAFEIMNIASGAGNQRGTLNFVLKLDSVPEECD